jgi:hypothetical protein
MEVAMRWALILLGIVTMANFTPKQLASALMIEQAAARDAQSSRRAAQQQIPGGLSPQEWDALNAQTDQWQGSQPDGVMAVMELSGKYRTGQITKQEYDEGMDILQGATLAAPKRRK